MRADLEAIAKRQNIIESLGQELTDKLDVYRAVKANNPNGYIIGGNQVTRENSPAAIRRTIIVLREQLNLLNKEIVN